MVTYPKIIAVCGLKRSGKDTIANYIKNKYRYKHCKISAPLKQCIKTLFKLSDDELELNNKDCIHSKWNIEPRVMMDFIGTHVFQYEIQKILPYVGRNFWINHLLDEFTSSEENNKIVISDLRFKHELVELQKHGVFVIKVINKKNDDLKQNYISETEICDLIPDYEIYNDTDIHTLYSKIDEIFSNLMRLIN